MVSARIKLVGKSYEEVSGVAKQITDIAKMGGIPVRGPIPLPRKRLVLPTRRTPCGDGSDTYEKWEMRIYKRMIYVEGDERVLKQIMRVRVPDTVHIEINLV
ncbi:MAG: 30S ribosomal protein S10 [Candidatus Micrarchaeota archaeon]|nr:30S ribosomal protein S10 [Candidatus Micrarchaeota archaeon]